MMSKGEGGGGNAYLKHGGRVEGGFLGLETMLGGTFLARRFILSRRRQVLVLLLFFIPELRMIAEVSDDETGIVAESLHAGGGRDGGGVT